MFGIVIYPLRKKTQESKSGKNKYSVPLENTNTCFICVKCKDIASMYSGFLVDDSWVCESCACK